MSFIYDYTLQMRPDLNGLTLIQINPSLSVDLRNDSETVCWLFEKNEDGWKKTRKVDANELDDIWDRVSEGAVFDAEVKNKKNKLK